MSTEKRVKKSRSQRRAEREEKIEMYKTSLRNLLFDPEFSIEKFISRNYSDRALILIAEREIYRDSATHNLEHS